MRPGSFISGQSLFGNSKYKPPPGKWGRFFRPILFAFPLSWWVMDRWLEGFAYRIPLSPVLFLAAGGTVLALTLFTISFQSVTSAFSSPAARLRSE